jgi:hypothetical protein
MNYGVTNYLEGVVYVDVIPSPIIDPMSPPLVEEQQFLPTEEMEVKMQGET